MFPDFLKARYLNHIAIRRFYLLFIIIPLLFFSACGWDEPADKSEEVVLNQRLRSKVQTLDPGNAGDSASNAICREIYECLYAYHYLKRPYELTPQTAAGMPTVSDDGLVYRIPIRNDVYFHDDRCFPESKGRLLVAQDFIYAWKRIANIKVKSKNWWIFDGKIVGLDEFREYSKTCKKGEVDYDYPVEGLSAEGDFTLVVKLKRSWPQLVYWLAYVATAPIAKEAVDYYGPDIVSHPVGTGAFQLKQWHRGIYLEAVRNPNYQHMRFPADGMPDDSEAGLLADADKELPFADRVIWRVVVESQPRWLLLMRGDIDINTIPKDNFGQAVSMASELTPEMKERGMKLLLFDEPGTFWIGFNMNDPVLGNNKPLRHAISHAVDRGKFIDIILSDKGKIAHGFIPLAMARYDETIVENSPSIYDLDKARRLLKEAEAVHGGPIPKLRLAIGRTDTVQKQTLQFLARSLSEIGLKVETELYDWPTFLEKMLNGQHQMFHSGWIADYPDAMNFLSVYYSKNAPWPNSTNYNNPEFDAIYEQVSVMPDSDERTALYHKAQRIVIEDLPCAFIYHRVGYIIHHGWLGNIKPDAYHPDTNGYGLLKYYKVDTKKRDEYRKRFK